MIQLKKQLNYLKRKLGNMTPAKKAGLVIGEIYVVVGTHPNGFLLGDEVKFIVDDKTSCPRFKRCYDGCAQYHSVRNVEPKQLSPQQQLEALLKTQQEQTAMITALQEQIKKEEGYDCVTPVCRDFTGNPTILFDYGKQLLSVDSSGRLKIDHPGANVPYVSEPNLFKWIPIERSELKAGDIAYRTNCNNNIFDIEQQVCAIVDERYCWFVRHGSLLKKSREYDYWYKLVLK